MQLFFFLVLTVYFSSVSSEQEGGIIETTRFLTKRSADPRGHYHSHGHIHVHTHIHKREISTESSKNLEERQNLAEMDEERLRGKLQRFNEKTHLLTDMNHNKTTRKMKGYMREVKDFIELGNNYIDQAPTLSEAMTRTGRSPRTHTHSHTHILFHTNNKHKREIARGIYENLSEKQNSSQLKEKSSAKETQEAKAKYSKLRRSPRVHTHSHSHIHIHNHGAIPEDTIRNLAKQQSDIQQEKVVDEVLNNVSKYISANNIDKEGNQIYQDAIASSPFSIEERNPVKHFHSRGHIHIQANGVPKSEISEGQAEILTLKSRGRKSLGKHAHSHGHIHVHTHGVHKREILITTNNNMNKDHTEKHIDGKDLSEKTRAHSKRLHIKRDADDEQVLRVPRIISRRKRNPHFHGHAHLHTFSSFGEEIPDFQEVPVIEVEHPKKFVKVFGIQRRDHHAHIHGHYHVHAHNIFR